MKKMKIKLNNTLKHDNKKYRHPKQNQNDTKNEHVEPNAET